MIIFLHGLDTFRSRKKLNELKNKFLFEVDKTGNSLFLLDGSAADFKSIKSALISECLFSNKAMVVVENIFKNKKKSVFSQILEIVKKETPNKIIIFWDENADVKQNSLFAFLQKQKFAQNFKLLSNTDTTRWIIDETKKRGCTISQKAAILLTSYFGNDLWIINNEINKLVCYAQSRSLDQRKIEEKDVELLSNGRIDEKIFALIDAVSSKNKSEAIKRFEQEIEAGAENSYLAHMIIRQIKILMQIKQAVESGVSPKEVARNLSLHPFIVQKGLGQVRRFSLDSLKKYFTKLIEFDKLNKTGRQELTISLSLLIAQL